jgi:hypothetical protein
MGALNTQGNLDKSPNGRITSLVKALKYADTHLSIITLHEWDRSFKKYFSYKVFKETVPFLTSI